MNHKIGKQQILVLILLVTMLAAASLLELGSNSVGMPPIILTLRYLFVFVGLLGVFLLSLKDKSNWQNWKFNRETAPLLGIWILFCIAIEVSGCINNDLIAIRDGYWLMIGVPLFFFVAIPRLLKGTGNLIVPLSIVISHMPFLLLSFILNPPSTANQIFYSGILGNSNQLGFVSAVTGAGILILLMGSYYAKKSYWLIGFLAFLLALILGILSIAFARTSIISLLFLIFIAATIYFAGKPKSLIKIVFLISFAISLVMLQLDKIIRFISYDLRIDPASMFQKKEAGLSGREEIWLRTIQELTLFGHGSNYYDSFEHGPHNTVIKTLGMYGVISMYITIFFAIASFIYAYAYFRANFKHNFYAIAPLIITTCFWTLSLGEDMFGSLGKGITLGYFATLGVLMTEYVPQKSSETLSLMPKKRT